MAAEKDAVVLIAAVNAMLNDKVAANCTTLALYIPTPYLPVP
jgi:hypothetical protein